MLNETSYGLPIRHYQGTLTGKQVVVNPNVLIRRDHPLHKVVKHTLTVENDVRLPNCQRLLSLRAAGGQRVYTAKPEELLLKPYNSDDAPRWALEATWQTKKIARPATPTEQARKMLEHLLRLDLPPERQTLRMVYEKAALRFDQLYNQPTIPRPKTTVQHLREKFVKRLEWIYTQSTDRRWGYSLQHHLTKADTDWITQLLKRFNHFQ